ncbi:MaoC family dehydratase [Thermoflexibacter ruber]|uniref:Acyl dehydratase n=1 Tax=Thermoflexibacter ruber TaxID=1003 RepID=A0A1I2H3R0_9BACT|nr:MaoC family dehydratase [Thermoflexibacter ruber]SFF23969.1 Acyl dehydratase [Thermoflexibacter ruber]
MTTPTTIQAGEVFKHTFSFSQEQVNLFMQVSGDDNPLHWDTEFASKTMFKKPIIHGFLGGSIFSKILGTIFPGAGSIYLRQEMKFLRPMFVDTVYEAVVTVKEIDTQKHKGILQTQVVDKTTGKMTIDGTAEILNEQRF